MITDWFSEIRFVAACTASRSSPTGIQSLISMGAVRMFYKPPDLVQEIFTRTSSYLCLGSVLLLLNYELYT